MKLQPGFKLLVCTVLFSAGLWAGRSEAASIAFDEFGIRDTDIHGCARIKEIFLNAQNK